MKSAFLQKYKLLKEQYETNQQNLIIVDVQPAYLKYIKSFNIQDLINYSSNFNRVLWFYNGESLGYDDNIEQWLNYDFDYRDTDNIKYFEKEYGYFRALIDRQYNEDLIVKILQYMIDQKLTDSRDLNEQDYNNLNIQDDEELIQILSEDCVWYDNQILDILKSYSPCILVGGGKNECLKEIQIYCRLANIEFQTNGEYVY